MFILILINKSIIIYDQKNIQVNGMCMFCFKPSLKMDGLISPQF